ncbi:MAG: hypothetical protein DIZ80_09535 [endosymbiont of Galathealinum brachiosum]|uniref:DUF3859 domain-containing protein n=1 Tax=endosymbiont of Galathealinum brachiosum TaxID=2200906 RepID=A0A370DC89_9GAMM|nr:MAG: hypothetical protein DIZ80_09535 [endosymbiont of Galathealinum brachiosum]
MFIDLLLLKIRWAGSYAHRILNHEEVMMKSLMPVTFIVVFTVLSVLLIRSGQVETAVIKPLEKINPSGRILQYGVYGLVRGGRIVDSKITTTGKAVSKPVIQQVEQTNYVPIRKDVYFAYQYRLSNLPINKSVIKLKRVLGHPEIMLPDGTKTTRSEYFIKGRVKRGEVFAFDGYAMNENYEMVEGDWVFQIWYEGKKMVEQKFTSYKVVNK